MLCKCCLVAWSWGHAGGETSWALLEESTRRLAGFHFLRPTTRRALVLHGCRLDLRQDFSEVKERGGVVTLGGGALNCWAKKEKSVCTVKLGERTVRSHHGGHEIFGDPERVDGSWAQQLCDRRNRQPKCR